MNHKEVEEVERTIDPNNFRRKEREEVVNRDVTPDHNVDFWEMSSNWPNDRDSSSESSGMPDLDQLLRNISKETRGNFRRPRYTEFRKDDEEGQQEEEIKDDERKLEETRRKTVGTEGKESKSDSEEESGLKTPTREEGRETPPQFEGVGFDELRTPPESQGDVTPTELKGREMMTPPVKPNFEKPIGASKPKPSALIAGLRRVKGEMREKCVNLKDRIEDMDKDLASLGDRLVQGVRQGEVRRSERNKNKIVNYKTERNPKGP